MISVNRYPEIHCIRAVVEISSQHILAVHHKSFPSSAIDVDTARPLYSISTFLNVSHITGSSGQSHNGYKHGNGRWRTV